MTNQPSNLDLLNPWSHYWSSRRDSTRAENLFTAKYLRDTSWLHAPEIAPVQHPAPASDLFFGRLPPEIRRQILLTAFGDQTVHMDLAYRHPWPHDPDESSHTQLSVNKSGGDVVQDSSDGTKKGWRWYSCVCHRFGPNGTERLSFGRRRGFPQSHFSTPRSDLCLSGLVSKCHEWPGEKPGKCFIGVMGWLLTCKQAYFEAIKVLYGTNTVHIASPILHQGIHYILPQRRLQDLVSLELLWQPESLSMAQGFTDLAKTASLPRPIFPSLAHLHISFGRWGERNLVLGPSSVSDNADLADRIHNVLFVEIDEMLPRVVPSSTEVVISCPIWKWYEAVDLYLVEKQGKERTQPQRADIRGLKCWRETPKRDSVADITGPDQGTQAQQAMRDGYWVHIPNGDVVMKSARDKIVVTQTPSGVVTKAGYDWHRHELYDLGEEQYGHS